MSATVAIAALGVSLSPQSIARAEAAASPPARRPSRSMFARRGHRDPELQVMAASFRLLLFCCNQQEVSASTSSV